MSARRTSSTARKLRRVYEHTQEVFQNHRLANNAYPTKCDLRDIPNVTPAPTPLQPTRVVVCNQDTLDMAAEFVAAGLNPLVLNMASALVPGGGVAKGALAQEECIFRRTNAFLTHPPSWYPLSDTELILSPSVSVVKNAQYEMLAPGNYFCVGLITVAAIRNPVLMFETVGSGKNVMAQLMYHHDQDRDLMTQKIEAIFKLAAHEGYDSLVLGAFGCGVYNNPPAEVAALFRAAIRNFGHMFQRIGFAVLVVNNRDRDNLETFSTLASQQEDSHEDQHGEL